MKIEILQDNANALMARRELVLQITHDDATPSFKDVRDRIVSVVGAGNDVVVVQSIKSKFGLRKAIAAVNIYKDKSRALQVERRHKMEKNFPGEFKPLEEEPTSKKEAATEKPPEVKKGEPAKAEKKGEQKKGKKGEEAPPKADEKSDGEEGN
ncbi:MAG: 30S ribosomal protein S24e [Candidatus Hydrothermarchaeaceae archaeon]